MGSLISKCKKNNKTDPNLKPYPHPHPHPHPNPHPNPMYNHLPIVPILPQNYELTPLMDFNPYSSWHIITPYGAYKA